jgi:hypothetical protein
MASGDCPKPYYCYDYEPYPSATDCDTQAIYDSGGSELILIKCGINISNPSDPAEIQALIDAGSLIRITGIAGGMDEPSAVDVDDPVACGSTVTLTYDRTLTWQDGKVSQAVVQWYNDMKLDSFGGALLKECSQNRWNWVDATVKLTSSRSMAQKSGTPQLINGVLTWRNLLDPTPYDYPAVTWP